MSLERKNSSKKKTVFILSVSSDIGRYLAQQYLASGWRVIGTYRQVKHVGALKGNPDCHLFPCDITRKKSVTQLLRKVKSLAVSWQTFISCVSDPQPMSAFFKGSFDVWSDSVHINAIEQLRVLHGLYPLRDPKTICDVIFFAGGGVNNAVLNFSAYTASKMMLIKMCEFLDAENSDLNVFIVGPGWTKTKGHLRVLADKHVSKEKRRETLAFLKNQAGTPMADIFDCIEWFRRQGKAVAGGRNVSVVYDAWKGPKSSALASALAKDPHMYKLRRCRNDFYVRKEGE